MLSSTWKDYIYLFPPIPLIDKVLAKFISDEVGHDLLICPYWPSQTWYPTLLDLLIGTPLLLPPDSIMDEDCKIPKHSRLLAWPIGSSHQEKQAYRNELQSVPCKVIDSKLCLNIKDIGDNSILGFIRNKIITVKLLYSVERFLYFLFKNGSMSTGNQLSVESLNQIRSSVSFCNMKYLILGLILL